MKPTVKSPARKWLTPQQRFDNLTINSQQRQGKVFTEMQDSGQFKSMQSKINKGY